MSIALDLPPRNNRTRTGAERSTRQHEFEQKIAKYRQQLVSAKEQLGSANRSEFYVQLPRQMQWLLKNDREWLDRLLPADRRWGSKVDRSKRDEESARVVPDLRRQLEQQDADMLRRVCKGRLINALRIQSRQISAGYYPKTLLAIEKASESSHQFKIRKLFQALESSDELPSTFLALLARLVIRQADRNDASLKNALQRAEKLFRERRPAGISELAA